MNGNVQYDCVIVKNRQGRVVCRWSSSLFSGVSVNENKIIVKQSLFRTKTYIPSEGHIIEATRRDISTRLIIFLFTSFVILCGTYSYISIAQTLF